LHEIRDELNHVITNYLEPLIAPSTSVSPVTGFMKRTRERMRPDPNGLASLLDSRCQLRQEFKDLLFNVAGTQSLTARSLGSFHVDRGTNISKLTDHPLLLKHLVLSDVGILTEVKEEAV
jgi:hypothetical protein